MELREVDIDTFASFDGEGSEAEDSTFGLPSSLPLICSCGGGEECEWELELALGVAEWRLSEEGSCEEVGASLEVDIVGAEVDGSS